MSCGEGLALKLLPRNISCYGGIEEGTKEQILTEKRGLGFCYPPLYPLPLRGRGDGRGNPLPHSGRGGCR